MKFTRVFIVCAALAFLSGCGTINEYEREARLVTKIGTWEVIGNDEQKAAEVEKFARDVKAFATNQPALTVDLLIQEIQFRIDWTKLTRSQSLLYSELLLELQTRLKDRFGDETTPAELQLTVEKVADWVIEAVRMT